MPAFRALYYPSWNPPVRWFRSTLLLFDQIQVIRPEEVENPDYDPRNEGIVQLLPHTFGEIRKRHYEMTLDVRNRNILASTLDQIVTARPAANPRSVKLLFNGNGVSVPGYTFLHISKLPRYVHDELSRRNLIHVHAERIVAASHGLADFRIVERNACNVILALIADHYGRRENLRTVTDESLGYLASNLNEDPVRRRDAAAMHLASTIIRLQVPERIADLTPKQYVSLRQRYDDVREPFQRAVRTLCDDHLLAGIESRTQFNEAVHDATREFAIGVDRLMKSTWIKKLGTFAPISLGVVSTLCQLPETAALTVTLALGLDACLKIYGGIQATTPSTDVQHAQRLMATLRSELMRPVLLRRLVLGRN